MLVAQYQFMSTSIRSIISSSRPSKLTMIVLQSIIAYSLVCFARRMYGLFQTMFFFSYMGVGSVALGLLCGECAQLSLYTSICEVAKVKIKARKRRPGE